MTDTSRNSSVRISTIATMKDGSSVLKIRSYDAYLSHVVFITNLIVYKDRHCSNSAGFSQVTFDVPRM